MDHTLETTGVRQIINQSINQFMDRSLNVACLSPLTGWITVPTRRVLLMPSRIISTSRCRMRLSVKNFASSAYSSFVPSCLLLGPCQWGKFWHWPPCLLRMVKRYQNRKSLPKTKQNKTRDISQITKHEDLLEFQWTQSWPEWSRATESRG